MKLTQSETAVGAVPGAADTWTDINDFVVPAGVKRLVRVKGGVAPDVGAGVLIHVAPVIRLLGSGLLEQSPHEYVMQGFDVAFATSGAVGIEPDMFEYDVDIPVQTGGQITVQINCINEIPAAMTSRIMLEYDAATSAGKNQMSQYVESDQPGAADVWAEVGTITIPQLEAGKTPERIREIVCGIVSDTDATMLVRNSNRFRFTGSGLKEGGLHEFLGSESGDMFTTPGAVAKVAPIVRHKTDLMVNAGGQILVECISDVEALVDGTAVCGVLYG